MSEIVSLPGAPAPTLDEKTYGEIVGTIARDGQRAGDVRVEGQDSFGRSYASSDKMIQKGIGAARRKLTSRSHHVHDDDEVVRSATCALAHLRNATREDVLAYFRNTWDLDATLFSALRDDAVFYAVPDALRRPLIFYFGHPACVYVNKLRLAGLMDSVNPLYEKIFETGVDEMSWDDMDDLQNEDFAWPSVQETVAYRDAVRAKIEALVLSQPSPAEKPVTMDDPRWAIFMGFEHERIHIETSSVLIHQLPVASVRRPATWVYGPSKAAAPEDAPPNALVSVPAARVRIGKPRDFPSFGWDNEYGSREVDVPAFCASKFLCTNAEFLPFVAEGGYREKRWWIAEDGDDEGWRWRQYRNATHPSFWVATADMREHEGGLPGRPYQKDDCTEAAGTGPHFRYRAMFDIIDMPWDWPVEVNYLEAKAFCRWKSAKQCGVRFRVATEAEHHRMRGEGPDDGEPGTGADGDACDPIMRKEAPGNINMKFGSSTPVDMFPASPTGFHDVHGNVWEWTEDHCAPLPGFKIHYLYDDFSAPCFDGWHNTILGGSWVSTGDQASRFGRYHFRRHFFQHLGFRYVVTEASEKWPGQSTAANLWEGQAELSTIAASQFPASLAKPVPPVPAELTLGRASEYGQRLAAHTAEAAGRAGMRDLERRSVLHLGAGLCGGSFQLARHFGTVVAVEPDETLVRYARVLQHHGELAFNCSTEGNLVESQLARVPGEHWLRARVQIAHCALSECAGDPAVSTAGRFDVVVVDDALVRERQPLPLLGALGALVRPGGVLLVSSSNAWDADVTPRNLWLGGFKMNGETKRTRDMLAHHLRRAFAAAGCADIPRARRIDDRRFEVALMEVTAWRRTDGGEGAGASSSSDEEHKD